MSKQSPIQIRGCITCFSTLSAYQMVAFCIGQKIGNETIGANGMTQYF